MNRIEMIDFIKKNPYVKITHELFGYDEYIFSKPDGNVYTKEGYLFEDWTAPYHDGIRNRNDAAWQDNWSLYDKDAKQPEDEYVYYIRNTISEYKSNIRGYFGSLDKAKEALQNCSDWYRHKGTGKIYRIRLNTLNATPELVYANPQ